MNNQEKQIQQIIVNVWNAKRQNLSKPWECASKFYFSLISSILSDIFTNFRKCYQRKHKQSTKVKPKSPKQQKQCLKCKQKSLFWLVKCAGMHLLIFSKCYTQHWTSSTRPQQTNTKKKSKKQLNVQVKNGSNEDQQLNEESQIVDNTKEKEVEAKPEELLANFNSTLELARVSLFD